MRHRTPATHTLVTLRVREDTLDLLIDLRNGWGMANLNATLERVLMYNWPATGQDIPKLIGRDNRRTQLPHVPIPFYLSTGAVRRWNDLVARSPKYTSRSGEMQAFDHMIAHAYNHATKQRGFAPLTLVK